MHLNLYPANLLDMMSTSSDHNKATKNQQVNKANLKKVGFFVFI